MFALVPQGVAIGFTAGVTPGSLMSYLLATTLSRGWRASLIIILAPLISDLPIIVFTVLLLGSLGEGVADVMRVVGGGFLLYIAYNTWEQFRAGATLQAADTTNLPPARDILLKAVVMNLLNPNPYIVWTTINGPLLVSGLEQSLLNGLAFLIAFYGTFMGLMLIQVFLFDRMGRIDVRFTRMALLASVGILALLGGYLIFQGLSG